MRKKYWKKILGATILGALTTSQVLAADFYEAVTGDNHLTGSDHWQEEVNIYYEPTNASGMKSALHLNGHNVIIEGALNIVSTQRDEQHGYYHAVYAENNSNLTISKLQMHWTPDVAVNAYTGSTVTIEELDLHFTEQGNSLLAVSDGKIMVGGQAKIYGTSWGSTGFVRSHGGSLTIGDNALIVNDSTGHKYSNQNFIGLRVQAGGEMDIGKNSTIQTIGGSGSHAVYVNDERDEDEKDDYGNGTGSYARIGGGSTVSTTGQDSYALYAKSPAATIETGDGVKVLTSGAKAFAVLASSGTVNLANDSIIQTQGATAYGLYALNSGQVNAEDKTLIVTKGANAGAVVAGTTSQQGIITLGSETQISTSGQAAYGLWSTTAGSKITTGAETKITTLGTSAHGIVANTGSEIFFGKDGEIFIQSGYGAYANNASTINIGENVLVNTKGTSGHGLVSWNGGQMVTDESAKIFTQGDGAYGLWAGKENSHIQLGEKATIITTGKEAYAVAADRGGKITLNGGTFSVAAEDTVHAFIADSDADNPHSYIKGDGVFQIDGSLLASDYGHIDLTLQAGSVLNGFTEISATGADLNLTMKNATWNIMNVPTLTRANNGVTQVTNLDLADSVIDFTQNDDYVNLLVENFTSNAQAGATLLMKANVADILSDQLYVTNSSSGNHNLVVYVDGAAPTTGNEIVPLVFTNDGVAKFSLDKAVDAGGFSYSLRRVTGPQEGDDTWELYQQDGTGPTIEPPIDPLGPGVWGPGENDGWELYPNGRASTGASAGINSFIGGYLLSNAEMQTLIQRLGELRDSTEQTGVWARVYGGKYEAGSNPFLYDFDMRYSGVQVGSDKKLSLKNGSSLFLGGMFGYSKGRLNYDTGKSEIDGKTLGFYATYLQPDGFYADLILKYLWMKNDFAVLDNTDTLVTGSKIRTGGFGASLEVGKRFDFRENSRSSNWYVEPQAQLSYGRQNGGNFLASNGLQVGVAGFDSLQGRIGILAGYTIKSSTNPVNLYAKIFRTKEFKGEINASLNGTEVSSGFKDSWWVYGIGVTAKVSTKQHLYLDLERASGGYFKQPWAIKFGYRFNF